MSIELHPSGKRRRGRQLRGLAGLLALLHADGAAAGAPGRDEVERVLAGLQPAGLPASLLAAAAWRPILLWRQPPREAGQPHRRRRRLRLRGRR